MVRLLVSQRKVGQEDTIAIYYRDAAFLKFAQASLQLLRELDYFDYISVRKRIRAIVQFGRGSSFAGLVTGVYIDDHTTEELMDAGAKRYAAQLVRFATELRLLDEWGIKDVIRFRGKRYERVIRISINRELACCNALGCEMRHIYDIRRWLRNHGNSH